MRENPLRKLQTFGQSVWLDSISRSVLSTGDLQRLIDGDGVSGVTSNPKIFSDAITGSEDYDEAIRACAMEGKDAQATYEALALEDVSRAADLLRRIHESSGGNDGFVSLEVSPHLAHDTAGTVSQARRLWQALNRRNILIKIPATDEGLPAIRQTVTEGSNVNVTLLFGLDRYRAVAEAYVAGIEARVAANRPVDEITSVASFFLSRIDVLIDPQLENLMARQGQKAVIAERLRGRVAIASAKVAYQTFKQIFTGERFRKLAERGAKPQRLLWASTSTKNPDYSDLMYVEPLIGPDTINTMPLKTLNAYREHGSPRARLEDDVSEARQVLQSLPEVGIDPKDVSAQLEQEGVRKFAEPFDALLSALGQKRTGLRREGR